jgi:hypothetical protein
VLDALLGVGSAFHQLLGAPIPQYSPPWATRGVADLGAPWFGGWRTAAKRTAPAEAGHAGSHSSTHMAHAMPGDQEEALANATSEGP